MQKVASDLACKFVPGGGFRLCASGEANNGLGAGMPLIQVPVPLTTYSTSSKTLHIPTDFQLPV
jgi:hypothetical protein